MSASIARPHSRHLDRATARLAQAQQTSLEVLAQRIREQRDDLAKVDKKCSKNEDRVAAAAADCAAKHASLGESVGELRAEVRALLAEHRRKEELRIQGVEKTVARLGQKLAGFQRKIARFIWWAHQFGG